MANFCTLRVPSLRGESRKVLVEVMVETAKREPVVETETEVMDSSPVRTIFATNFLPCRVCGSGSSSLSLRLVRRLGMAQMWISRSHQLITRRRFGTLNSEGSWGRLDSVR